MEGRAFTYIFALIYPALLGTFLFGAFTRGSGEPVELALYLLMLVYFLVQFGEGQADEEGEGKRPYGGWRIAQDIVEMIAMVFVFAGLGGFAPQVEPTAKTPPPWLHRFDNCYWPMIAAAVAIPPIFRSIRCAMEGRETPRPSAREQAFGPYLTLLSLLAMIGCVVGDRVSPWAGVTLIALALLAYLGLFVVWRERTRQCLECLEAWHARFTAPRPSDPPAASAPPDGDPLPARGAQGQQAGQE